MNCKIIAFIAAWSLFSCLGAVAQETNPGPAPANPAVTAGAGNEHGTYTLGAGDKLRVIVFNEENLSGEFVIDGTGYVRLPLIGQIQAAGLTVFDFEKEVTAKLNAGYLVDAKISVEVINYRPFYIIGEVNKPGEYPFVSDMNILNAVALAGGYTFRADDTYVFVRAKNATKEERVSADQNTKVNPGDIIRVAERFF
jgi:protein involved in polysaccharide export with SLBB domain